MKTYTRAEKEITIATDPILAKIRAKDRKLGRKQSSLWHTKEIKIPREIEKIGAQMDECEIRWKKRIKELGLWE